MTLYTSPQIVKRDTPLGSTIDEHLLAVTIRQAQDKEILPMLGTQLDKKLKADIEAGTLAGEYKTLMDDYIVPALVQFTFAMVAPVVRVRFSNNSVSVVSSEQGQSADFRDIKPLVDNAKNMAEFYREQGIKYILNDTSSFPEYNANTGSDLYPMTQSYGGVLNIGRDSLPRRDKVVLAAYGLKRYL